MKKMLNKISRLIFILILPCTLNAQTDTTGKEVLQTFGLPTAKGYHLSMSRCARKYGLCQLILEVFGPDGKNLATGYSLDFKNSPMKPTENFDLGNGFKGPAWTFEGSGTDEETEGLISLGVAVFSLDKRTSGLVLELEGQGADWIHHFYEIWAFTPDSKPSLRNVFEETDTGPRGMILKLDKSGTKTPFYLVSFTQDYEPVMDEDLPPNQVKYEVRSWDEQKGAFPDPSPNNPMSVPLYAAILASKPTLANTRALLQGWLDQDEKKPLGQKVSFEPCASQDLIYSTADTPLLKPGTFFIGRFFLNEGEAQAFVRKAHKCHPEEKAFVKRAY